MSRIEAGADQLLRTAAGQYRTAKRKKNKHAQKEGLSDALRLAHEAIGVMRKEFEGLLK